MSILFSGDFHAGECNELSTITKKNLLRKYRQDIFDKIQYHIILGDGGFMWQNNRKTDIYNYKNLAFRPFPVLCVLGNHDPIYGIKNIPEVDIGIGENVYQINAIPFVAYLKRGKIYFINGIKILVLGGALSIDKRSRIPNKTWWEEEYWNEKEKKEIFKLLETDNIFDIVISHTGCCNINSLLFSSISSHYGKLSDEVALLNNEIHNRIQFKEWWCGHWHKDDYYYDKETNHGYQYLYRKTKIIEKVENNIVVTNEFGMLGR